MKDNQRKAMFAKGFPTPSSLVAKPLTRKEQFEHLDKLRKDDYDKRSKTEFGLYQHEGDDVFEAEKKLRGSGLNLNMIIYWAKKDGTVSPDNTWTYSDKAYHVSDIPNNIVWSEYTPKEVTVGKTKLIQVNETNVSPEKLLQVAKDAKKRKLLEKGTVAELLSKGIFDATKHGEVRPISIKLGDNTYLVAPRG